VPDAGGQESVSGGGLLIAAYLLIWAILFGFIFITWKKQRSLKEQLDRMEAALDKNPE
jgi:CcmD family protein